jgi:hypothetical protein
MTVAQRDPALHERLTRLAADSRVVVVAGLPGTGKSLVIHQLAHLAAAAGRAVHLLQWDVARPVFEASEAGRPYPVVNGVTQPMIRKAVGLWARRAMAAWHRAAGAGALLIVEAPLVGGRLIELARRQDDEAEPLLGDSACRFVIAVPSVEVRRYVEDERARRATAARHPREREDAPPHVLRELWREVAGAARARGIAVPSWSDYDPLVYHRVYETVLRKRAATALVLATILPTERMSVYEFAVPCAELLPTADDVAAAIRDSEARFPDAAALARDVERWWVV